MSAWARLVHWDGSDEFLELCNEALLEVQREHAHVLAEKIRQHWYPRFPGKADYTQGMDAGYDRAADLIDPEVSSSD